MDVILGVCTDLPSLLLVSPLVLCLLRGQSEKQHWKLLAASAALVISTNLATQLGYMTPKELLVFVPLPVRLLLRLLSSSTVHYLFKRSLQNVTAERWTF